mmetsp:Transcript_115912/g.300493  ORF Transcript_115912/g.300493 Transcript_115912/m.300493 type:complete len:283 (-) Transcript_115912:50-898(-)
MAVHVHASFKRLQGRPPAPGGGDAGRSFAAFCAGRPRLGLRSGGLLISAPAGQEARNGRGQPSGRAGAFEGEGVRSGRRGWSSRRSPRPGDARLARAAEPGQPRAPGALPAAVPVLRGGELQQRGGVPVLPPASRQAPGPFGQAAPRDASRHGLGALCRTHASPGPGEGAGPRRTRGGLGHGRQPHGSVRAAGHGGARVCGGGGLEPRRQQAPLPHAPDDLEGHVPPPPPLHPRPRLRAAPSVARARDRRALREAPRRGRGLWRRRRRGGRAARARAAGARP